MRDGPIFSIDADSHSARMLTYLREVFHARGMRYADVAKLLGVSEKSIKRYMAGRGVTLPLLERLCATVGMTLRELSELSPSENDRDPAWTTDEQEHALISDPRSAFVLGLLTIGWSAPRILREGLTSQSELNAILVRLDRLGVITLYPNNRLRVRARLRHYPDASEALRKVIAAAGARVIAEMNFSDKDALWRLNYARLGPASAARIAKRLDVFLEEVVELARQDMDLSSEHVQWYAVCGLMLPYEGLGLKLLQGAGSIETGRTDRPKPNSPDSLL